MYEGSPLIVQRFLGVRSGRGGQVSKLRVKNIVTGQTMDLGLDSGEKLEVGPKITMAKRKKTNLSF